MVVGAGGDQVQRDTVTITGHGPFRALRPDTSPPHGDFVMAPSTAMSSRFSPIIWSNAASVLRSNS